MGFFSPVQSYHELFRLVLKRFSFYFCRFSKQYSKDYKAKEVSEGEETKDFWNVLGGKTKFKSLSGGAYWNVFCIFINFSHTRAKCVPCA